VNAKIEEVGSQKDIKTKSLLYRYHKSGNPLKEARMIQGLLKAHSQEDVATLLELSQGQISKRLRLLSLLPQLQNRLLKGTLRPSTAYALSKLSPDKQKEYLTKDRITLKEVEADHRKEILTKELMEHLTSDGLSQPLPSLGNTDSSSELSAENREEIRHTLLELAEIIRKKTNCTVHEASQCLRDLCP
jgi:ParB-like chromosome segregation protein Spo0J